MSIDLPAPQRAVQASRRFTQQPAEPEYCELCHTALAAEHPHVLELEQNRLLCSCPACALLFADAQGKRFRQVPATVELLPNFCMTELQWHNLEIPIGLAFISWKGRANRPVALYPGPAGMTEAVLQPEDWQGLVEDNPVLSELQPDVEGLLINRLGREEYYRLPIDECYRLAGVLRGHWRGLSGGPAVWEALRDFFVRLRERAGLSLRADADA